MNDWLDEEFPLGHGVMDPSAWIACPFCGADFELALDPGGGAVQEYIEDCEVCCRPLQLSVSWDHEGVAVVSARTEEEP